MGPLLPSLLSLVLDPDTLVRQALLGFVRTLLARWASPQLLLLIRPTLRIILISGLSHVNGGVRKAAVELLLTFFVAPVLDYDDSSGSTAASSSSTTNTTNTNTAAAATAVSNVAAPPLHRCAATVALSRDAALEVTRGSIGSIGSIGSMTDCGTYI
eukprot:GHVU01165106.1.p3 GENE.GHVU01165106.1~~GHVU01165106.1.p3  ORF type:complete len:157 (+),score=28.34 GHVU01165106.1:979-1449(+)